MGKEWDGWESPASFQRWCLAWAAECLRVLKPGGHLLAFGGTRTYHRLACAVEDAGFEIRDSITWLYGSGFPKSLDVGKAIDKRRDWAALPVFQAMIREARTALGISQSEAARRAGIIGPGVSLGGGGFMWFETGMRTPTTGQYAALKLALSLDDSCDLAFEAAEREVLSETVTSREGGSWAEQVNSGMFQAGDRTVRVTAPATLDAARWDGWGTALKPASEPIVVARKPVAGTVAACVLANGTGALNIDGCRVAHAGESDLAVSQGKNPGRADTVTSGVYGASRPQQSVNDAGRWPPNVLLTHSASCGKDCTADCPVAKMDLQSGALTSGLRAKNYNTPAVNEVYGRRESSPANPGNTYGDTGGASRFFPAFRYEAKAPASERPRLADGTAHPTVKPLDLMRWLVRLVTPPGGLVLDIFGGSGTTAEACVIEGFRCIIAEKDPASADLIVARLSKPIQPDLFGGAA